MENKEIIDLLVFDMIMPKKSGKEAYERIRQLSPGVKVLFVSGHTVEMVSTHGIVDSAFVFLTKPVPPDDFLKKIREVIEQ